MFFVKPPFISSVDFFELSFTSHSRVTVMPRAYNTLSFRKSGCVEIITDGTRYVSTPGSLTFISEGAQYETAVLESGEMMLMHFTTENSLRFPSLVLTPAIPERFSNVFAEAMKRRTTGGELFAFSYAYRLLGELERALIPLENKPPRRMSEAKRYIDEHLTLSSLKISEAASIAGISDVYFRAEFRRFYGSSPIEYVKSRRIELAKKLLSTGLLTVTDAAMSSGFESVSYFSSEFKRATGMSPSNFAALSEGN